MNTARTLSLLLLDAGFLYYLTVDSHVAESHYLQPTSLQWCFFAGQRLI
jgi:hypothetical protein